ncbi:MAG: tyrosine-type recombinase/integrase [Pseudomonadota bacterium]
MPKDDVTANKIKFTDAALKRLKPGVLTWDTECTGLAARRGGNGVSFIVKYRVGRASAAKTYRRKLGDWTGGAGGMGINTARELVLDIKLKGKTGIDYFDQTESQPVAQTFGEVFEKYLAAHERKWSDGHARASASRYDRYLKKSLGNAPITSVKRLMISDALLAIKAEVQRNRTATLVATFYNWAVDIGYVDASPAVKMKSVRTKEAPRNRVLIDKEGDADGDFDDRELRWLLTACSGLGDLGDFVRFMLLTGARVEEAAGMTSDELDLGKSLWRIPARRNKSRREYTNVLVGAALDILPDRNGLVWQGPRGGKLLSNPDRDIKKLRSAVGEVARDEGFNGEIEPFGFHDLRRTLVSWLQRQGYSKEVRDAVTNHKITEGADASYSHAAMLQVQRKALGEWADYLKAITVVDTAPLEGAS